MCPPTHALVGLDGRDLRVVNVSCDVLVAENCWELVLYIFSLFSYIMYTVQYY